MDASVLIGVIGVLVALSAWYTSNLENKKYRFFYIERINDSKKHFEPEYYQGITLLLNEAEKIFGKNFSIASLYVTTFWALSYSSLLFVFYWLIYGKGVVGGTEVIKIQLSAFLDMKLTRRHEVKSLY